jgi:hypothetical protein
MGRKEMRVLWQAFLAKLWELPVGFLATVFPKTSVAQLMLRSIGGTDYFRVLTSPTSAPLAMGTYRRLASMIR